MRKERLDFPKEQGLSTRTAIFVPSTQDVDKPVSDSEFNRRTDEVRNYLNKKFGGSTSVHGVGSYTTKDGKLVKEKINIVENFSDDKGWLKQDKNVKNFIQQKAKEWGQESVGFEFESKQRPNTRLNFVEPAKKKMLKAMS